MGEQSAQRGSSDLPGRADSDHFVRIDTLVRLFSIRQLAHQLVDLGHAR